MQHLTEKLQRRHHKILSSQAPFTNMGAGQGIKKKKREKEWTRPDARESAWGLRGAPAQSLGRRGQSPGLRGRPASSGIPPERTADGEPHTACCAATGPRLPGAATRYKQRGYPAGGPHSPTGGKRAERREGAASVDCGNRGIRLGLPLTWASRLPLAQQRSPGRATENRNQQARALSLFFFFPLSLPARFPARSRPSSKPKIPSAPSQVRVNQIALSSRERLSSSLPSATSECANEKGGGRSRRKHCGRHYPLFLSCCNLDVSATSRFFAAYRLLQH